MLFWLEGDALFNHLGLLEIITIPILILFIVWMINAYNFMDGIDGMAVSGALCITGTLTLIMLITNGSSELAVLFVLLMTSVGAFIIFNWPPASIFMGDSGSVFLGYVFGSFILITVARDEISLWTWLVIFGYFFADTTFLSDSFIDQRGHTSKEDGGLANTEGFDSYAISVGGKDFYSLNNNIAERIFYRLGYAHQEAAIGNEEDEVRYSISLGYKENFSDRISKTLIFEYMDIEHYSGEEAHDRSYFSTSLGLNLHPWSFATTYTFVDNDAPEEPDENHDGKLLQISIGYSLSEKLKLDFGFKRTDEEAEVTERFGLGLKYVFEL